MKVINDKFAVLHRKNMNKIYTSLDAVIQSEDSVLNRCIIRPKFVDRIRDGELQ